MTNTAPRFAISLVLAGSGDVVFWTGAAWSSYPAAARRYASERGARAAAKRGGCGPRIDVIEVGGVEVAS
jgi:hypothetical protein